jgi:F0F1-type ATP synthase assembly protein I
MVKTDWKSKATEYALDKKLLKKRIKELTKSRDEWKEKSISHKARADKLASDLKKLKSKLIEMVDNQ